MKRLLEHLGQFALDPGTILPDSKLHRFQSDEKDDINTAWYVASQGFSARTGEPYFLIVFGDVGRALGGSSFCTLAEIASNDRKIIAQKIKAAEKLGVQAKNDIMKQAEAGIARAFHKGEAKEAIDALGELPPLVTPPNENDFVAALGFRDKDYFYTSSNNRQIVCISKFSESDLLGLMPIAYWETAYPGAGAQRVDWTSARSHLMHSARERGIFQSRNIRGAGVWNDDGRVVVNMGDHLLVDGQRCELGYLESRYFYTLGNSLSRLSERPLSADECGLLTEACANFKWVKDDYGYLLAGALVVGRVCGALPIRPHVWITGGAQTGKSTLIDKLIKPMLGPNALNVIGNTSEAGIRQSLSSDAVPVMFDEFESSASARTTEQISMVLDLLRSAWSETDAVIVKGGASGTATSFQVRCCAFLSSIRTKLINDADVQRYSRIELRPHGEDSVHWKMLSGLLSQIDEEYSNRLFARTVLLLPVLLENFKIMKRVLSQRTTQRFSDQYGMLLAGYSILLDDAPLNEAGALFLASRIPLDEERAVAKVTDHEDALDHLISSRLRLDTKMGSIDLSLGEAILMAVPENVDYDLIVDKSLQRVGIKVTSHYVAIAARHPELEKHVFKETSWKGTWANSLARLKDAIRSEGQWMAGANKRCVKVPIGLFKPPKHV